MYSNWLLLKLGREYGGMLKRRTEYLTEGHQNMNGEDRKIITRRLAEY
jgi:hypothetical protein